MRRLLLIMAAVILSAVSCTGRQPEAAIQKIHIEGNKFVNESGKTVVFQGLCLADPVKLIRDGQWSETIFEKAAEWGANVVRFAVHPTNLNMYGWDKTFAAMDQGIEWAKAHDLYVVMDWHSIGNLKDEKFTSPMYRTTMEETLKFWRTVADRYKDEPAVAVYELFNEPTYTAEGLGTVTWSEWKAILETIIDAIREIDPDAVCMCAGFNWAYDIPQVATEPIERDNIAYVSHPYPMKRDQPWEEKWEADFGFVADKYPVFLTEMGFCLEGEKGAHIPVISTEEYGDHITKYIEKKGLSYTVWCFDPDWAPTLIEDWSYVPTTQGKYFKNYLQNLKK